MDSYKYCTVKGDTFDTIAYSVYGDTALVAPIMDANPAYIETAVFGPNVTLEIPKLEKTDDSIYLPPWRR